MKARLSSIVFDKQERPLRATIVTSTGTVKVGWSDVCGNWCWMTSGTLEAKKLVISTIQRIEKMIQVVD